MNSHFNLFDISNEPKLLELARQVRDMHDIRVLQSNREPLAVVVPMDIYTQWEKEGDELLAIMNKAASTANLSPKTANQLADKAVHTIRVASHEA